MLTDDIALVSVDNHVVEPPNVWIDRFPHVVDTGDHSQEWVYEGRRHPLQILGGPRTRNFRRDGTGEDLFARRFDNLLPGCYDANERTKAMDEDGASPPGTTG